MSVNQYMSRDVLLNLMIHEKIYEKIGINHLIYSEQLSHHDFLAVDPKQALQPNLCCDLVCVPEQSSLVVQEVGSPIAESQQNPSKIVPLTKKKRGRNPGSKNKKYALPKMAIAKLFIIKLLKVTPLKKQRHMIPTLITTLLML